MIKQSVQHFSKSQKILSLNLSRTIRNTDETAYELVILICLFKVGLTTYDLQELQILKMVPQSWIKMLQELFSRGNDVESTENSCLEEQKSEMSDTSPAITQNKDFKVIMPGNYFWIVISRDSNINALFYNPSQLVNRYIDKKLKPEVTRLELQKLEYLTLLSLSFMHRLKQLNSYNEKLTENSTISQHGIWAFSEDNAFYKNFIAKRSEFTYLDREKEGTNSYDLPTLKRLFNFHAENFNTCVDSETIETLIQSDGNPSRMALTKYSKRYFIWSCLRPH